MSRVLVTGANGHVGCNLVRMLLDEGHTVVAFTREGSNHEGLVGLDVVSAHGDVRDAQAVATAAEGADVIVNLAAVYDMRSSDVATIVEPAIRGIENVLRAAKAQGTKRVVHTSSTVAVGFGPDPSKISNETDWNEAPGIPYTRAKTESERHARKLAAELSVPMVTINPSMILGPRDYRITPSADLVRAMLEGDLPSGAGGLSIVDVRDVARAHLCALEAGEPGERYIVSGGNVSMRELAALITEVTGFKIAHMPAPRFLLPLIVPLITMQARIVGRAPPASLSQAQEFVGRYYYVDGSKAETVFGLTPRGPRQCVESTIAWLLFRGRLSKGRAERLRDKLPPDPAWSAA